MTPRVKIAYTCSSVPADYQTAPHLIHERTPRTGDVGIFRVIKSDGKYLKGVDSASQYLFTDDHIMAVFGPRYATSQYEAYLPTQPVVDLSLVGRGGVVALVHSQSARHSGDALPLEMVAFVTDSQGEVINTREQYQLPAYRACSGGARVLLSVGSSMDSGKTTTAAFAAAGLERAGHTTAFIKLTGTAFPKDSQFVLDRGASYVTDFSRAGYPSTFRVPQTELLCLYQFLVDNCVAACQPDFIVVELADGILQPETGKLLQDPDFMSTVSGTMLSCGDSLGILSGLTTLRGWGIEPCMLSGLFSASQLLINEVQRHTSVPVLTLEDMLAMKMIGILPGTTIPESKEKEDISGDEVDVSTVAKALDPAA